MKNFNLGGGLKGKAMGFGGTMAIGFAPLLLFLLAKLVFGV